MKGHVRKRASSWAYVVELGKDAQGKRRQQWKSGFRTRKDAQAALTRVLHQLENGGFVEPHKVTVGEFLEQWLTQRETKLAPTTYATYRHVVHSHLVPGLGSRLLLRLTALHVQDYYTAKRRAGIRGGALAEKTVRRHHAILTAALKQAVKWRLVPRNVCEDVDAPSADSPERSVLNPGEILRLIQALEGDPLYLPVLLTLSTGMRRGEILGLRWSEVDLDRKRVSVTQTLSMLREGEPVFAPPKTEKSRRGIRLPEIAVEALGRRRAEQAQDRLLCGPGWKDYDLVVTRGDGRPPNPDVFSARYRRVVERLQIPQVTFHDLRHSHSTFLLLGGVDLKRLQRRLGHASIRTTGDIYSHLLEGDEDEQVARVADAVLRGHFGGAFANGEHAAG